MQFSCSQPLIQHNYLFAPLRKLIEAGCVVPSLITQLTVQLNRTLAEARPGTQRGRASSSNSQN